MTVIGRNGITSVAAAIVMLLLVPARVRSQDAPTVGELRVRIVEVGGQPVMFAELLLRARKRVDRLVRSDSNGIATLTGIEPGLWTMTVRRIGVRPVSEEIRIERGRNEYTVIANDALLSLGAVRVIGGHEYSARLDDFERRRLSGTASAVVTRDAIDKLAPVVLTRMLRGIAGVRIADSSGYIVAVSTRGAKPSRNTRGGVGFGLVDCVMRVSVDGTLMPALFNIDQIPPRDVYGIEVYDGPSRMPPQLGGLRSDNWCGLIAVWTRDR